MNDNAHAQMKALTLLYQNLFVKGVLEVEEVYSSTSYLNLISLLKPKESALGTILDTNILSCFSNWKTYLKTSIYEEMHILEDSINSIDAIDSTFLPLPSKASFMNLHGAEMKVKNFIAPTMFGLYDNDFAMAMRSEGVIKTLRVEKVEKEKNDDIDQENDHNNSEIERKCSEVFLRNREAQLNFDFSIGIARFTEIMDLLYGGIYNKKPLHCKNYIESLFMILGLFSRYFNIDMKLKNLQFANPEKAFTKVCMKTFVKKRKLKKKASLLKIRQIHKI